MTERRESLIDSDSGSTDEWSLLAPNRRRRSSEGSIDLLKAYERELGDEPTDTVREYLRSIGQHALLTAPEELELGLDVERWMLLKETRKQMTAEIEREPTTTEVAAALVAATVRELLLLRSLAGETGFELPSEVPVSVLLRAPDVRTIFDKPPTDALFLDGSPAVGAPFIGFHAWFLPLQVAPQLAFSCNRPLTEIVRRFWPAGDHFPGIQP